MVILLRMSKREVNIQNGQKQIPITIVAPEVGGIMPIGGSPFG
jgi:hypothetical protein